MIVMTSPSSILTNRLLQLLAILTILALALPATTFAGKGKHTSFSSPEKAVQRLFTAVKTNNVNKLVALLGPGSEPLVISGDTVADATGRKAFVKLYQEHNRIEHPTPEKSILIIGAQDHPFPIPLVKKGNRWHFDTTRCSSFQIF